MGQPAARLGDPTAHGGAITSGNPTVLIGGRPAATVGDAHVCPVCSPGPHVGGPVLGGAPTVLIGGRPAARVGDPCACAAPAPDVVVSGEPTVLIGGASGASPAAAAAAASAFGATARAGTPGLGAVADPLSPWVGAGYVDAAGRPVTGWDYRAASGGGAASGGAREGQVGTGGQVWLDALAGDGPVGVGLVGVYGCRWAKDEARVGEAVAVSARCVGIEDGALALFEVWRETATSDGTASREKVWEVMGRVEGGRVEAVRPFVFAWPEAEDRGNHEDSVSPLNDGAPPALVDSDSAAGDSGPGGGTLSSAPVYVAEVTVDGRWRATGGRLTYQDWVEVRLLDESDRPRRDVEVTFYLPSGESRRKRTDSRGVARVDGVPPRHCDVEFPPAPVSR